MRGDLRQKLPPHLGALKILDRVVSDEDSPEFLPKIEVEHISLDKLRFGQALAAAGNHLRRQIEAGAVMPALGYLL
jgi:hypothetical protein